MSTRPVPGSPAPEPAERGLAAALTWLQNAGETPVVNPAKQVWEPPEWRTPAWVAFALAVVAISLLIWFWTTFTGARPGFIYEGF